MNGVILCAGLGTRLRPITDHLPKPLVPVAGCPMIHYPLALLRSAGITKVILNAHYMAERLQQELGHGNGWGMSIHYSVEPQLLGTGGGLRHLLPRLDGDSFVVLNADQITDIDLPALIDAHRHNDAVATLAVISPDPALPHHRLHTADGLLVGLAKGGEPVDSSYIFTGVQVIDPQLFQRHHPPDPSCIFRDYLLPEIASGGRVAVFHHQGAWLDTGDEKGLREAEARLPEIPSIPTLPSSPHFSS